MDIKKQMTIRINRNLLNRIELYREREYKRGKTVKKIDVIEEALLQYLDKLDDEAIKCKK